jgi:glucose-1-phosphate thymidylyltransferase
MGHEGADRRPRGVVGLVPAGGQATRLAPLPCSKELYPVGFGSIGGVGPRPKVACQYLLEALRLAGTRKAYVVLAPGKWDIPAYLGDGSALGMDLAYVVRRLPFGTPYTLDQAYPFVHEAVVAFGFPDILFEPADAFTPLLERQATTNADVVLGLFPHDDPRTADMVDLDETGRVRSVTARVPGTALRYAWVLAVWTARFTDFMHDYLAAREAAGRSGVPRGGLSSERELSVGDLLQAALESGLHVDSVSFPNGLWVDIGTPDGLARALRTFG